MGIDIDTKEGNADWEKKLIFFIQKKQFRLKSKIDLEKINKTCATMEKCCDAS